MILKFFEDVGLSHISYIVADETTKEAVIIDPKRNCSDYINYIEEHNLCVVEVLNTHPHADFVSGHKILSEMYNVKYTYHYEVPTVDDMCKQIDNTYNLNLGNALTIQAIQTPGHTPFCITYLLSEDNISKILFTGDFLFNGNLGRADLLGEHTKEQLIENSYESVLMLHKMEDHLMVCPSHNGGSFCGKDLKNSFITTLGIEKKANFSFYVAEQSKKKFIQNLQEQQIETPAHFKKMGAINIKGAKELPDSKEIKTYTLEEAYKSNIQIIDMRVPSSFATVHLQKSINIAHNSNVALIAGSLLEQDKEYIVLLPNIEHQRELLETIQSKFGSVGIDNLVGVVFNGLSGYKKLDVTIDSINCMKMEEFIKFQQKKLIKLGDLQIDTVVESEQVELSKINKYEFDDAIQYTFLCANDFKSMAAISVLEKKANKYFLI